MNEGLNRERRRENIWDRGELLMDIMRNGGKKHHVCVWIWTRWGWGCDDVLGNQRSIRDTMYWNDEWYILLPIVLGQPQSAN